MSRLAIQSKNNFRPPPKHSRTKEGWWRCTNTPLQRLGLYSHSSQKFINAVGRESLCYRNVSPDSADEALTLRELHPWAASCLTPSVSCQLMSCDTAYAWYRHSLFLLRFLSQIEEVHTVVYAHYQASEGSSLCLVMNRQPRDKKEESRKRLPVNS